jgi:hypothetical protein
MVDEIIGEKFLEQVEIATSLHLFGVTPDDTLGDLAYRTPTHRPFSSYSPLVMR